MTANSRKCGVLVSGLAPTSRSRQWPVRFGQHRREGRPVDALDRADDHLGRDHGGPGVARRDEALGPAVAHAVGGDADRGVALLADRGRGRVVHRDDLGRVHDLDVRPGVPRVVAAAARARAAGPRAAQEIPNSRAAATAPSTLTRGAWSPPIASTAIRTSASLPEGITSAGIIPGPERRRKTERSAIHVSRLPFPSPVYVLIACLPL